jgi:Terpene cyclase DEP1
MLREFQLLGEKTDQRRVRFSFNRRCTQFDPNRAAILAGDAVDLSIRNDVNAQNCHSADRIGKEAKLLDGFCRRTPLCASMKARRVYLILCVLGFVIPYSQFVPWLLEHGLNLNLLFRELFANRISAFFAMDVIISAIVVIWFIQSKGKRLRVKFLWLPTIGTLVVGVSFGFPLFLFLRQVTLDRATARA